MQGNGLGLPIPVSSSLASPSRRLQWTSTRWSTVFDGGDAASGIARPPRRSASLFNGRFPGCVRLRREGPRLLVEGVEDASAPGPQQDPAGDVLGLQSALAATRGRHRGRAHDPSVLTVSGSARGVALRSRRRRAHRYPPRSSARSRRDDDGCPRA